jgi:hypothetical protein
MLTSAVIYILEPSRLSIVKDIFKLAKITSTYII